MRIEWSMLMGFCAVMTHLSVATADDCRPLLNGFPLAQWNTLSCTALGIAQQLPSAPGLSTLDSEAEKTRQKFEAQGFNCGPVPSPPKRPGLTCICDPAASATCLKNFGGYPSPVALVIPLDYQKTARPRFVVHFHGNSPPREVGQVIERFGLAEGLRESKRNEILVVPLSPSQRQSNGVATRHFRDNGEAFRRFIDGATAVINDADLLSPKSTGAVEPASIALSSHSGGCFPVAAILRSGGYQDRIRELLLFDSTYSYDGAHDETTDPPVVFAEFGKQPGHRLWSTYTDHNAGAGKNAALIAALDRPSGHCARGSWKNDAAFPSACQVSLHACGFVHVGANSLHDTHVSLTFGKLLAPPVPPLTDD